MIEWLPIVNTVWTTIVAFIVFFWKRDRTGAVEDAKLSWRIEQMEKRLERAGQKSSDLMDKIQILARRDELMELEKHIEIMHVRMSESAGVVNASMGKLATALAKIEARMDMQDDIRFGRRQYDQQHPGEGEDR
jgi:hypothetical protein